MPRKSLQHRAGGTSEPEPAVLNTEVQQVPEDVWQLRAPVDELVLVGQRGGERDELDLVTAEALRLGGHVVELQEEGGVKV